MESVADELCTNPRVGEALIEGFVDLLFEAPDGLVVVDYKSGRRHLSTADVRSSLALAVYAAATSQTLRRPCRQVELHHPRFALGHGDGRRGRQVDLVVDDLQPLGLQVEAAARTTTEGTEDLLERSALEGVVLRIAGLVAAAAHGPNATPHRQPNPNASAVGCVT